MLKYQVREDNSFGERQTTVSYLGEQGVQWTHWYFKVVWDEDKSDVGYCLSRNDAKGYYEFCQLHLAACIFAVDGEEHFGQDWSISWAKTFIRSTLLKMYNNQELNSWVGVAPWLVCEGLLVTPSRHISKLIRSRHE